ncbi:MAG: hypothetical protein WD342_15810 [Verrucomicrobiales bacterium]
MPERNPQPTPASGPEEVIQLACPSCSAGLNVHRKHLGIEGTCVNCRESIKAVEEESGKISMLWTSRRDAASSENDGASQPSTEPPTPTKPDDDAGGSPPPSAWGFPDPKKAEPSPAPFVAPSPMDESVSRAVGREPEPPASGFFETFAADPPEPSSKSNEGESGDEAAEDAIPSAESPEAPPLFEPEPSESYVDALFAGHRDAGHRDAGHRDDTGRLNAGWGTKVPHGTHASISPFSTGSAEPGGGFAEALFRKEAQKQSVPVSTETTPFPEGLSDNSGMDVLFGSDFASPSAPDGTPESSAEAAGAEEDDARPATTPEEAARVAGGLPDIAAPRGSGGNWDGLKKLAKPLVTLAILSAVAYGGYAFTPNEKKEEWQGIAVEWLEPGLVIFDYLPFDVPRRPPGAKASEPSKSTGAPDPPVAR